MHMTSHYQCCTEYCLVSLRDFGLVCTVYVDITPISMVMQRSE